MKTRFTKMHGLGNDFVILTAKDTSLPATDTIRRLADRRLGIGCDQLLWLEPARHAEASIRYRIFNQDGSEAEQCGNGARCIARYLSGGRPGEFLLEHAGGLSTVRVLDADTVSIDLGVPDFEPAHIPFIADHEAATYELDVNGEKVVVSAVSIGNPHAVLTVTDIDEAPVERLGPQLESHARFPNRANIGFAQMVSSDRVRLRVFERGVGETRACGTGACAAVATGRNSGKLADSVLVELPGGEVTVSWQGPGSAVWLTGEAVTSFEGTVDV